MKYLYLKPSMKQTDSLNIKDESGIFQFKK